MQTFALKRLELESLLIDAARLGAQIAVEELKKNQMLNKAETQALLGIKAYATLRKLTSQPGFPRPRNGRYSRAEIEAWAERNQGGHNEPRG